MSLLAKFNYNKSFAINLLQNLQMLTAPYDSNTNNGCYVLANSSSLNQ